jgi:uncharacterized protein YjbI with pentapeptide repeats
VAPFEAALQAARQARIDRHHQVRNTIEWRESSRLARLRYILEHWDEGAGDHLIPIRLAFLYAGCAYLWMLGAIFVRFYYSKQRVSKQLRNGNGTRVERNIRLMNSSLRVILRDLDGVDLVGMHLMQVAMLRGFSMQRARLDAAVIESVDLSAANLTGARLRGATVQKCDLSHIILRGAVLTGARLADCNLSHADLSGCDLTDVVLADCRLDWADLVTCQLQDARIERCSVHGLRVWDSDGTPRAVKRLTIRDPSDTFTIYTDSLVAAQLINAVLGDLGVRELVDGASSSLVLLLGRFAREHKMFLDSARDLLREKGYAAIEFDGETPSSRDNSETVAVLARMCRFVVADATSPQSVPHELGLFAADACVPFAIIVRNELAYSMSHDYQKYPWFLGIFRASTDSDYARIIDTIAVKAEGYIDYLRGVPGATGHSSQIYRGVRPPTE